jgi:2-succinyl-5-enolpyruvyl-6-hydroxy-3-cyclohexene-1-carboxylate synthase
MPTALELDFRNTNALWCSVLAETLHRCGVRHAVVSPGSRSTPLTFAFARHAGIEAMPVLDERSAGFFALGLAKQHARPVALVCTSGTAAANYFPAVIEAREGGAPLVVITADRPPELRECASGQTIDQQKLYGAHVVWYHELATPEASLARLRYLRQTVAHACERALRPEPGPVHLNAPFRDPLPPLADASAEPLRGKIGGEFFAHLGMLPGIVRSGSGPSGTGDPPVLERVARATRPRFAEPPPENMGGTPMPLDPHGRDAHATQPAHAPVSTQRGLIIAGPFTGCDPAAHAGALARLAAQTGWPVLADALSPARHHAMQPEVVRVSAYDEILRNKNRARELAPEFVLCVGGWPISKVLRSWLDQTQPEILLAAPTVRNRDALHGRTRHLACTLATEPDCNLMGYNAASAPASVAATATATITTAVAGAGTPATAAAAASDTADTGTPAAAAAYRDAWRRAETDARTVLDAELDAIAPGDLFEPGAVWRLARHLPESTPLFVANSMPVRDAEYFWPANDRRARFYFNRGANGIDGTLSTALGIAHGNPRPAVLLTGDLSLLHDANGFLIGGNARFRGSLTIVLINNQGGGIFEHLPVASFEPPFEDYFATPQQVDFALLCAAHGVEHILIRDWAQFTQLITALPAKGVRVLEIPTDRKTDTARRQALLARGGG